MSDSHNVPITDRIAHDPHVSRDAAQRALKLRLETVAVHAGAEIDSVTGAIAPPLYLSTTFEHGSAGEAIHQFLYTREKNPTQLRLEGALRDLEGGTACLAFSSGMAAAAALLQTLSPRSHVIFSDDIYIDVRNLVRTFLPAWGVESASEDLRNLEPLKAAIRPNTKLVWIETPSNPLLKILDIRAIADITHEAGAQLVVDNTFASPVLQRPSTWNGAVATFTWQCVDTRVALDPKSRFQISIDFNSVFTIHQYRIRFPELGPVTVPRRNHSGESPCLETHPNKPSPRAKLTKR